MAITASDIQLQSYESFTNTMSAMAQGLATTINLLDRVSIKKFDEIGVDEGKGSQLMGWTPPVQGQPTNPV